MARVSPIDVQKSLKGVDYPASKEDLLNRAKQSGADQDVLDALQNMPGDTYNSPNDVSEAIGKIE